MPGLPIPKVFRLFAKVAVAYLAVFGLWILAAKDYHLLLGQTAGRLIPLGVNASIDSIWYDQAVRYKISFQDPQTGRYRLATGAVDTLHFGYPIITFLVLATALPGPPWRKRAVLTLLGAALLFTFFSILILIAIYEALGQSDIAFLRENSIARIIPPSFYFRYQIPVVVFLGQVLPVSVYGLLFFRPFLAAKKRAGKVKPPSKTVHLPQK